MRNQQVLHGVILAGGKSSRMGQAKERLDWGGQPLLLHLVKLLKKAGLPVLVVSNSPQSSALLVDQDVMVSPDLVPSHGPISGICTAMRISEADAFFICACDLPFLDLPDLAKLVKLKNELDQWDVIVVRNAQRLHPLLALYHRRTQREWEAAMSAGSFRLQDVFDKLQVKVLPENFLSPAATYNMNTVEQYHHALAIKGGHHEISKTDDQC